MFPERSVNVPHSSLPQEEEEAPLLPAEGDHEMLMEEYNKVGVLLNFFRMFPECS
jgi:hypothetical protein